MLGAKLRRWAGAKIIYSSRRSAARVRARNFIIPPAVNKIICSNR